MAIDWKTGVLAAGAVAIWGVFFVLTHDGRPAAAKKLVAHSLRDPASAQFRDVVEHGGAVCGEVNGKNGFGAYAGFKHFIVVDDQVTVELDLPSEALSPGISRAAVREWDARNEFTGLWLMRCQTPLPALPAKLEPDFPGIKP